MARSSPVHPAPSLDGRRAALGLLRAALERRGGLESAMNGAAFRALDARERAFARALVMATLRHLGPIDAALRGRLATPPPNAVRDLLRLGFAQAVFLDVPAFAAVDTTVALAPKPFRGLVNAVLRGQLRDGAPPVTAEVLVPPWLWARWRSAHGEPAATAVAEMITQEPATDLTSRRGCDPSLVEGLGGERLAGGGWRTRRRGDVTAWPGFAEGLWWVQDAAAAVPARLLAPAVGERVLDLCAAPGGKTMQLADAGATVTALDRSPRRLRQLARNLQRTALNAEVIEADAVGWADDRQFDAVLLDAPCSATGTFRRHPDVPWNARPADIVVLAQTQADLLDAATGRVRPGGRLIYSVCSLEPEEGEDQVRAFLARHRDFAIQPAAAGEGGAPSDSLAPEGWLRILPHHRAGGLDGFFVARLRRVR